MNPSNSELKITIAKLIEVAYSQNSGVTTSNDKGTSILFNNQNPALYDRLAKRSLSLVR